VFYVIGGETKQMIIVKRIILKKKKGAVMKVKELIKKLEQIKDKELYVVVADIEDCFGEFPNHWVKSIEEHETGSSGYEIEGEVRLLTSI
tara:strand:+ start:12895 stop:13164 length:270 start_codon:yes stop_codon:yes gene_type:complete